MKPIYLSMQAFGPFAEKEEVDFTRLGENPLFLINGPTGAGKSTLLDAICFSLYGQAADDEREPAALRSDMAESQLLTEVQFQFALGEKQYRIARIPAQNKPKQRGEGFTTQATEAKLWEMQADGNEVLLIPKKATEVTEKVVELTGLTAEQFRQVMVLPQGKFRALLLANSQQREGIFSQLFQTSIYRKIEEKLKQRAAGIEDSKKEYDLKIAGLLESADSSAESELKEKISQLKPLVEKLKTQKDHAFDQFMLFEKERSNATALWELFKQKESCQNALAGLGLEREKLRQTEHKLVRSRQAALLLPVIQAQEVAEKRSESLQQELDALVMKMASAGENLQKTRQGLELATTQYQQKDALNVQIHELERYREKMVLLKQKQADNERQQAAFRQINQTHTAQTAARQDKQQQLEQGRIRIVALQSSMDELSDAVQQLDQAEHILQLKKRYDLLLGKNLALQERALAETASVEKSRQACEKWQKEDVQLQIQWHQGQAALLAKGLRLNEPCPVCGSTIHPQPTQAQQVMVSKEDLEASVQRLENARQHLQKMESTLIQTRTLQEALAVQINEQAEMLGDKVAIAVTALQETCEQARKQVNRRQQARQSQSLLQEQLGVFEKELSQQDEALLQTQEKQQVIRLSLASIENEIKFRLAELPEPYRDAAVLAQTLAEHKQRLALLQNEYELSQRAFDQARQEIVQIQERKAGLQNQQEQTDIDLRQARQSCLAQLEKHAFDSEQACRQAVLADSEMQVMEQYVARFNRQQYELEGQYKRICEQLEGKTVPDLVQMESRHDEIKQLRDQVQLEWQHNAEQLNQLESVAVKIGRINEQNAGLEREYAIYGTLSHIANGRGDSRISLQRFVLSVLLDDVLADATVRLRIMSKGRYQLIRKEDRAKGNSRSGLDLEVMDEYTGIARPAATLSGGESFMAALSLALGLSDVVQAYAGGIRLDTLFIDEGFGSLDMDSLDLAIRTLLDLQASGRTVGIISHVTELKEQMALRIDVLPSAMGSSIQVKGIQ